MSENGTTLERLEEVDLRERVAMAAYESVKSGAINLGSFNAECDTIYGWIIGRPVMTNLGRKLIAAAKGARKELQEIPKRAAKVLKGKRKYTKKSKYWAKKKKSA